MDDMAGRTWNEPSPLALSFAIDRVDRMTGGAEPRDSIEKGIAIHLRLLEQRGTPFTKEGRSALVKAVERVGSLDLEIPKAPITGLASARMITFDVDLQREAGMIDSGDVLDRYDFLDRDETKARGVTWDAVPNVRDVLMGESPEGISSIAAGDFHELFGFANEALKAGVETHRLGGTTKLDVEVLRAGGLIDDAHAARLTALGRSRSKEDMRELMRLDAKSEIEDLRSMRSSFGPGAAPRETVMESYAISRRISSSLSHRYLYPEDVASPELVARSVADASFPDPETPQGVAVKEARALLVEAGLERALERPAFMHALERGLKEEGVISSSGMAQRIAYDVAVQLEARRLLKTAERRASGQTRSSARSEGPAYDLIRRIAPANLTSAVRDVEDLRAIGSGDFSKASFDMSNHLRAASAKAWSRGVARDRAAGRSVDIVLDGVVMVPDKSPRSRERFGLVPAERPSLDLAARTKAQQRIDSLTKGPSRAPGDWIASMAKVSSSER